MKGVPTATAEGIAIRIAIAAIVEIAEIASPITGMPTVPNAIACGSSTSTSAMRRSAGDRVAAATRSGIAADATVGGRSERGM